MIRLGASACLALCLVASAAWAAGSIRVLMSPGASQVVVFAPRGIIVTAEHGEHVVSSVRIAPGVDGMIVDGAVWPVRHLTVSGSGEDLSVQLTEATTAANGPMRALLLPGRLDLMMQGAVLEVFNELDLESYVAGVVPWEMNAAWPPEALKAQAVAARTYALYQQHANPGRHYDVVAGTQDQVYAGRHPDPRVQEAVEATRGLVLMHAGVPILAAFSSTAAGPTEDAMVVWAKDLPYLKGVDCPFDTGSPHYTWRASFTLEDLETGLRKQGLAVGSIATIAPLTYSRSGRVARLRVLHSGGELILRGEELRRAIGYTVVPSTLFELEALGRTVILSGRGAGHGVGLCQWGTKELAALGYRFPTILQYYFPGTELVDPHSR